MNNVLMSAIGISTTLFFAVNVKAVVVDFEDLGVAVGTQLQTGNGATTSSGGFDFSSDDIHLHFHNQDGLGDNGGINAGAHGLIDIVKSDGGAFSLAAFDFEYFLSDLGTIFVGAELSSGGMVNTSFSTDGIFGTVGSSSTYETFSLGADFNDIVSARIYSGATNTGSTHGFFIDNIDTANTPEPSILALIDIKPGSDTNPINLKSKGVLPVAILGTEDFDVSNVDIDSLLFGDPALLDMGGTSVSPLRYSFEDVSDDGLLDLSLKFSMRELVDLEAFGPDSVEGLLSGEFLDGILFTGLDSVRTVPPTRVNGNSSLSATNVPEPTTIALALIGLCLVGRRRR